MFRRLLKFSGYLHLHLAQASSILEGNREQQFQDRLSQESWAFGSKPLSIVYCSRISKVETKKQVNEVNKGHTFQGP